MLTLASDFGTPYPAAMKGVVLQRTDARLVDVAHDLPRQDVRAAAFWLREVLPWFPPAVHLVVVDPGVGTDRAALAVRAGDHALVGPDNGVLLPAARALAGEADRAVEVFEVAYADPASTTFHGRDVFAPAAADVHEVGVANLETLERVSPVDGFVDLTFPEATVTEREARGTDRNAGGTDGEAGGFDARGEVLVVDGFGNVVTNVPGRVLDGHFGGEVLVDGDRVPVRAAYAAVGAGERLVTVGSHGNVELAVNQGRGDEAFGLRVGEAVRIESA